MSQTLSIRRTNRTAVRRHAHLLALVLIAALSFGLNFFAISKLGYGNAYYAAAIKSMTESFHNFFYVSFDPAGMVSVDKPPLALWIQALFVLAFGYHGWAMLLPQALAGTGSCLIMYALTAKYFGRPAGLISSLVLALTPAVVVASRNNTMDMQLIFVLLVATWFLFKSIECSRWRYLFLAALFVGLGFNIKMLQAYMILPAVALIYLIFAREKFLRRVIAGLISLLIMATVSFAWVLAVDLTPASSRPYVGSSTNNTVWELIIGHNGLERLYGQGMGGGNGFGGGPGFGNAPGGNRFGGGQGFGGNGGRGFGGGQGGAAGNDIGTAGILRLWNSGLYGQASWLIMLALFGIAAKLRLSDIRKQKPDQAVLGYWIIWLAAMVGFFSFAGFWHRYYLCMLAPAIAGLTGAGLSGMVQSLKERHGWRQFLLPVSLAATFVIEILYVWSYSALRTWLVSLMTADAVASLLLMGLHYRRPGRTVRRAAAACLLLSLLAAPFYWSLTAVMYVPQNITMPYAGPELASTAAVPGMTSNQETLTTGDSQTLTMEKYLVAHYRKGSYLVVSQRADDVAQFIVDTGLPAVAYGGFLGSDNSMTLDRLKELVQEKKVTYFLVSGQSGNSNSELISYVEKNATLVSATEYGGSDSQNSGNGFSRQSNGVSGATLYLFQ